MLQEALNAVTSQNLQSDRYEVIVADNGSTDATPDVAREHQKRTSATVQYVREPMPGSHRARNAAAKAARGDIIVLIDDDVMVTPDWLGSLLPAFGSGDVGLAGGPIHVRWVNPPPAWVDANDGLFGYLDYGTDKPLELHWPQSVNAGNMAIRKDIYFQVGGYPPCTATQDKMIGDGEVGLVRKIYRLGKKLMYMPGALVHHVQDGSKVTLEYMMKRRNSEGKFSTYLDYRENRPSRYRLLRRTLGLFVRRQERRIKTLQHSLARDRAFFDHAQAGAYIQGSLSYSWKLVTSEEFRRTALQDNWIS